MHKQVSKHQRHIAKNMKLCVEHAAAYRQFQGRRSRYRPPLVVIAESQEECEACQHDKMT